MLGLIDSFISFQGAALWHVCQMKCNHLAKFYYQRIKRSQCAKIGTKIFMPLYTIEEYIYIMFFFRNSIKILHFSLDVSKDILLHT